MDTSIETTGPNLQPSLRAQYSDAAISGGLRRGFPNFGMLQLPVSLAEPQALKFAILAGRWRRETRSLSVLIKMVTHPAYQEIIGIGMDAVPLILRELRKRPAHWFWALRAITGEDPVPDGADFHGAVRAWLLYGRMHGYLD